ncbi:LacI family DNA-binding transcriptional regulator [Actinocorallia sp. B10E7]|uniref:LacI family DNA-binding transcriptional regulator n=1 Tax=Actinocorallia sp. B10E7 TaxID=3153558 RepID=UPI00325E9345
MPATIFDVARAAEVSTATVSNALNGTGRVSEATRRRVREAAERLGYRPNVAGRALRTGRTGMLALGVTTYGPHEWNFSEVAFYTQLITAATATAHRHGYALTILPATLTEPEWQALAVDGVILLDSPQDDPAIPILRDRGIPIAFDGRPWSLGPRDSWVDNDHAAATEQVIRHLRDQNATRIALVTAYGTDLWTRTCAETYRALVPDPLIDAIDADDPEGRAAAERVLRAGADAVYGLIDGLGRGALAAARDLGLRVPDDVLIATCSEDPSYAWTAPPVTTLSLFPTDTVALAVTALADTLSGFPASVHPGLPTRLTVRESSSRRETGPAEKTGG